MGWKPFIQEPKTLLIEIIPSKNHQPKYFLINQGITQFYSNLLHYLTVQLFLTHHHSISMIHYSLNKILIYHPPILIKSHSLRNYSNVLDKKILIALYKKLLVWILPEAKQQTIPSVGNICWITSSVVIIQKIPTKQNIIILTINIGIQDINIIRMIV